MADLKIRVLSDQGKEVDLEIQVHKLDFDICNPLGQINFRLNFQISSIKAHMFYRLQELQSENFHQRSAIFGKKESSVSLRQTVVSKLIGKAVIEE